MKRAPLRMRRTETKRVPRVMEIEDALIT